ncbi:MAG: PAS domain S-box protein [Pseudomonadales bacterium]|nr:PAS domain S-box protein [Pseudomonadales bacterium]
MHPRHHESYLATGIALVVLACVVAVDVRFADGAGWLLPLYCLPVVAGLWLPPLAVFPLGSAVLLALTAVALFTDTSVEPAVRFRTGLEIAGTGVLVLLLRLARDELRESRRRVTGILDGSDTGFVRTDAELGIEDANEPFLRMVGARRLRDVVGTRLVDWFPPDRRRNAEAILAFLAAGDRRSFETVMRPGDAGDLNVVVTVYAERVAERIQLVAVFADVTAIRRAEAQAQASEQQLRAHLENTPLAAVVLDAEYRIRGWNRSAERIFGYERDAALGMSAWELVPEAARTTRASPFAHGEGVRSADGTFRVVQRHRDGRELVLQWYHTPLPATDGSTPQLASLGLDVSHQVEVEQALRVSEVKFSSVFQQSPDALVLVRLQDGRLIEANETLETLFGWTRDELEARWGDYGQFWRSRRELEHFTQLALAGPVEAFETELVTRERGALPVLISARRLTIGGEETMLLTIRDFTPIREAEEERYRLQEQLRQAQHMEGIGRLAGGVAHDFNNMLAGIQGYTELMADAPDDGDQVRQYSTRVLETCVRAADLVRKLLVFARQGAMDQRDFDLRPVIHDTLDLLRQTLDPRIRIVTHLAVGDLPLCGDESQISNALLNLCVNARDAIDGDGEIEVVAERVDLDATEAQALDPELAAGPYVVLSVRDTGCGMSPSVMADIFEPFFSTKPKGQGTGLGLPSVYGAAKAHGGTVRVTSHEGEGSCFRLYLPARVGAAPAIEAPATRPGTGALPEPCRTLVVDDEPGIRDILTATLRAEGFEVTVAEDGLAALERFKAEPDAYDLVLMDCSMPRMTGEEALRKMRHLRAGLPVILMSGFDQPTAEHEAVIGAAAGSLAKPFTRDALLREIARVCNHEPDPHRDVA